MFYRTLSFFSQNNLTMIFTKVRTVKKALFQLRGRLNWLLKLAAKCKKYIIDVLDIEARIKHLERVERSFGLSARGVLEDEGQIVYEVYSSDAQGTYIVNPRNDRYSRCECMDCLQRGTLCKHQIHVERVFGVSSRLIQRKAQKNVPTQEFVDYCRKSIFG